MKINFRKARSWLVQLALIVTVFIVVSHYLARNMLEKHQDAPTLSDHQYKLLERNDNALTAIQDWPGAKQHLVYFFAPWCTVCALSQPSLQAFKQAKPHTQIIMVALDWSSVSAVKEFQQKHQFDFPIILGDAQLKHRWQVDAYPSYYFVNQAGTITSKDRGLVTLPGLFSRSL